MNILGRKIYLIINSPHQKIFFLSFSETSSRYLGVSVWEVGGEGEQDMDRGQEKENSGAVGVLREKKWIE